MRLPGYKLRRRIGAWIFLALAYLILLGPILCVAASSLDNRGVVFPPRHVGLEAYWAIPGRYWQALGLSLELATVCTFFACLIGIPAAFGIVRGRFRGKAAAMMLFRAPLQIPAVVSGIAFLEMYYALEPVTGWFGGGTFLGLLLAHVFAATPYVVGTLVSVLQRFDGSVEEAALVLGATRLGTLRQVTLPMLRPGIFAGALYAFMLSFGEVPMSVFLTGSTRMTFPVEVFNSMQFDFEPTILSISTIVTLVSLALVIIVQRIVGLDMFVKTGAVE